MAKDFQFGAVHMRAAEEDLRAKPRSEEPFLIALLGDFSGRTSRRQIQPETIETRPALLVDRDNFEEVLAKVHPRIRLPIGERGPEELGFSELDHFHPDHIFQHSELFRKLRDVRAATLSEAPLAGQPRWRPDVHLSGERTDPQESPAQTTARIASGNLLDAMIAETETRVPEKERTPDEVREFARRAVQPHLVPPADRRQAEMLVLVDQAASALMRALLHQSEFQALEGAWRAVFLLVRQIETSSSLKIFLMDVSKEELAYDVGSAPDLPSTRLYRNLVDRSVATPGAEPWALIAGNYSFGPGENDIRLLSRLGAVAQAAGAPFLAAAQDALIGCDSVAATPNPQHWTKQPDTAAWAQFRLSLQADWIGLALPRFLLRLPYGKNTSPVELFDFEEMADSCAHEDYLWGNSAFACALLLAEAFNAQGWDMYPGLVAEFSGLPLHVHEHNGAPELKPCAETLLPDRAAERIAGLGCIPLISVKGRDAVRLGRFQALSGRALAGRWGRAESILS